MLFEAPSGDLRRELTAGAVGAPAGECDGGGAEGNADLAAFAGHGVAPRAVEIDDQAHRIGAILRQAQIAHGAASLAVVVRADGEIGAAEIDDDTRRIVEREVSERDARVEREDDVGARRCRGDGDARHASPRRHFNTRGDGRMGRGGSVSRISVRGGVHVGQRERAWRQERGDHCNGRRSHHGFLAFVVSLLSGSVSCRLNPNSSMVNCTAFCRMAATRSRPSCCPTRTRYCCFE